MATHKVALVVSNNVWFCPYVYIYTDLLKTRHVDYDIISWNRNGKKEDAIQYNYTPTSRSPLMLLWAYRKFASFVKKTIKKDGYDRLIVFTSQLGIFLCDFLKQEFEGRYIFDFRDLSLEQKVYFKRPFLMVLRNSFANVISSPGFKKYLPSGFSYILSHNFNVETVRKAFDEQEEMELNRNSIDVLTIGGIRDYETNVQVMEHLLNVEGFTVRFVGEGPSAADLQKRAEELNASNVYFEGYYPKEKEKVYVSEASFLNIFYPRKPSHDTAISNRFYNSLIYRKPMITTKHTTQGDYAELYKVGLALESCENLPYILKSYLETMDMQQFCQNSNQLLADFLKDYEVWEKMVLEFIK